MPTAAQLQCLQACLRVELAALWASALQTLQLARRAHLRAQHPIKDWLRAAVAFLCWAVLRMRIQDLLRCPLEHLQQAHRVHWMCRLVLAGQALAEV